MPPRGRELSPYIPSGNLRDEPPQNRSGGIVPSPLRGRPHQQQRGGQHSGSTPYRYPYGQPPPEPGYPHGSNPYPYAPYPPHLGPYPPGPYGPHFAPPPGAYPHPGPFPPGAYPPPGAFPPPPGHGAFPQPGPYNFAQAPAPPGHTPGHRGGGGGQHHYSAPYPQVPLGATPFGYPYPYTGGVPPGPLPPFIPGDPPPVERPLDAGDTLMDTWATGPDYGPVLTPLEVGILDVKVQINPLLAPTTDMPSLEYNVLLPVRTARRSTDPQWRSWASGRSAPATFPRVTKLYLISKFFSWMITIDASNPAVGVTCSDVLHGLHDDMNRVVSRHQVEALAQNSDREYRLLMTSYRINRSTARYAPGGEFGAPVKRGDFLHRDIMFDGIVEDEAFTLRKLVACGPGWKGLKKKDDRRRGYPVTFVLNLDQVVMGRIHGGHLDDSETSTTDGRDDITERGETTTTEQDT